MDISGNDTRIYSYIGDENRRSALYKENEIRANKFSGSINFLLSIFSIILLIFNVLGILVQPKFIYVLYPILFAIKALIFSITRIKKINNGNKWLGYLIIIYLAVEAFILSLFTIDFSILFMIVPIALTCKYYSKKMIASVGTVSLVLFIISTYLGTYICYKNGILDLNSISIDGKQIITIEGFLSKSIIDSGIINFDSYYLSAALSEVVIGVPFLIIFIFISYSNTISGNEMINEEINLIGKTDKIRDEIEANKLEIMISQIQPHFLYNVLNSIYYLCEKNPKKAEQAILDFSDYLRTNLNFSKKDQIIPFRDELNHINKYLSLEKMRFEDDLEIEYEINTYDFRVPSLSIQPLVENAVKHGITKKSEGGTLKIKTDEDYSSFILTIEDDGAGFDTTKPFSENRKHIGLENSKYRLETQVKASFNIDSSIGVGTKIRIIIPKEYYYEDTGSR